MELRDISMEDLPLYESLMSDPSMMAELGGPLPRQGLRDKLREIVDGVEAGTTWYLTIIPDDDAAGAGTVCMWEHVWKGETINEIGWMVLPRFQGRGLAGEAVHAILDKARSEARWDVVHAFPATTNAPSNSICRKAGFSLIEACDFEFAGRILRCNHWRTVLRSTDSSA